MQTILQILKMAGGWHPGLYLQIDNAPYMELVIEAMDESGPMGLPALSVAHYGEQNGDSMRDPEMCFELGFAGGAHLDPWYWRNDFVAVEQWSRNIVGGHYVHLFALHEQHVRFAKTWDNNLRLQGVYRSLHGQVHSWLVRSLGAEQSACLRSAPLPSTARKEHIIMETQIVDATEYRNVTLALLSESKTNPRRTFEEVALKELASSIRTQGVLSPLLVRPLTENGFEIIAGARRYRAAQMAEVPTVPVRIVHLSDAAALEAQLVENLVRSEIHPMEEAQGFRALLDLEDPKYSIEQIAAKVGKSPVFVASRLKLSDLVPAAVDAFYADEIGVGHALLLAKLPADQQEAALQACFKEVYNGGSKPARILLPVRNLQFWIDSNILLVLKDAPFNKRDAQLVPTAGSCADCPKRTGHNKLLFGDDLGRQGDRCTDPNCYAVKVSAHVAQTVATKPELVQISTAYGAQKEGSAVLPRNSYTAIRDDKPKSKDDAKRPEFKVCKFTTEAIITEGPDVGTIHKVCANPTCPVHHPKHSTGRNDEKWKAEQDKQRKEQAIANTTGLRVLAAVSAAVPVRLLKRDLLFIIEKLVNVMDENRVEMLARQHGIRQKRDDGGIGKTLTAFVRRADEGTLSRLIVEASILLASSRANPTAILKEAATAYKVDTEAIAAKVKQEFAVKDKAKKAAQPAAKVAKKAA